MNTKPLVVRESVMGGIWTLKGLVPVPVLVMAVYCGVGLLTSRKAKSNISLLTLQRDLQLSA